MKIDFLVKSEKELLTLKNIKYCLPMKHKIEGEKNPVSIYLIEDYDGKKLVLRTKEYQILLIESE